MTGGFLVPDTDQVWFYTYVNPIVWGVNLTLAVQSGANSSIVDEITLDDPDAVIQTATYDTVMNELYLGSLNVIYKLNPQTLVSVTIPVPEAVAEFQPLTSASDNAGRCAYFPSDDNNLVRVNYTAVNTSYVPLTSQSEVMSSVIDSDLGFLYLGSANGDIEKIDLAAFNTCAFASAKTFNPSGATATAPSRAVAALDTTRQILYFCTDVGNDGAPRLDYFNATDLSLLGTLSLTHASDSTNCGGLTIDIREGNLFVALSDPTGGLVTLVDLTVMEVRQTSSLESLLGQDVSVVTAVFHPLMFTNLTNDQIMFIATDSEIMQYTYLSTCADDCSGHGTCYFGVCDCEADYDLVSDCSEMRCPQDCNNNGNCTNGQCVCFSEWTGTNCSTEQCPNACNNHGTCSGYPTYVCTCTNEWSGEDCSVAPPAPPPQTCAATYTSEDCVSFKYCGWCMDSGKCLSGSIRGPYTGSCEFWFWRENYEVGIIALACIFVGILALMFFINAISAVRLDFARAQEFQQIYKDGRQVKPTHAEAKALWWRDQRSAKTWLLVEQMQFLALISHIALDFPSRFLSLTKFFDWTNFGLPLPWYHDTAYHPYRVLSESIYPATTTTRSLLGFEQYGNSLGFGPRLLFGSNMFWFGLVLAVVCVIYGIFHLITTGKIHWQTVLTSRLVYNLVRLINMGYMGIVMTSSYGLVASPHKYNLIVPSFFALLIVGFGWPLAVFFVLFGRGKRLFDHEFKLKFGALYVSYRPEDSLFIMALFARKFFTGAAIGFLAFSPTQTPKYVALIQAGVMALAQIGYAVAVFLRKPYYDYYQEYLEYFLTVINLVTVGFSMVFFKSPTDYGEYILTLVQTLALVACVGTYIVSWLQMNKDFSFFAYVKSCCGRKDEKSMDSGIPLDNDLYSTSI